jgi:hypothetical protein
VSCEGHDSSSKEGDNDESIEEDPMAGSFLRFRSSDEDDDRDDGGDSDDGANSDDGSTSDDGAGEAVTVAMTMMMVTSAQFLQSSVVDFHASTGGSVSIDVSSR